jgi:large subunit ribosomal protein L6
MSRIGKQPIVIPEGVTTKLDGLNLQVTGPRGTLTVPLHPHVKLGFADKMINVHVLDSENVNDRALWGLFRRLIDNAVIGVTKGFTKSLELVGVGYKVAAAGQTLTLNVGYSHPVTVNLPEGITGTVDKNIITLTGNDKQAIGELAAQIRRIRKPEPYKGKGIKYVGEVIRRKAGKAAKAVGK